MSAGDLPANAVAVFGLAGHVPVREVAEEVYAEAVGVLPRCPDPPLLRVSPSVSLARLARRWPAPWAAAVAASVDTAADDAEEVLEVLLGDRRTAVRRELAALSGLPDAVAFPLLEASFGCGDGVAAGSVLAGAEWSPATLADVLSGAVTGWISPVDGRLADVIAGDAEVAGRFVAVAADLGLVEEVLVRAAHTQPSDGGARFVDLVPAALGRTSDPFGVGDLTALLADREPARLSLESLEWLSKACADLVGDEASEPLRFHLDAFAHLEDPELIAAWWRSGIPGVREALLGGAERVAPPTVARVVAAELVASGGPARDFVFAAQTMCRFDSHGALEFSELDDHGEVAGIALDLLHRARTGGELVKHATVAGLAVLWERLVDRGWFCDDAAEVLVGIGELCPSLAGPLLLTSLVGILAVDDSGVGARLRLLFGEVAADPVRFGVSAPLVRNAAGSRTVGGVCPERWAELVSNTPGVVAEAVRVDPSGPLGSLVGELLTAELGEDPAAWRSVVSLAGSWEGPLTELVAVARTFTGP